MKTIYLYLLIPIIIQNNYLWNNILNFSIKSRIINNKNAISIIPITFRQLKIY